MDKFHRFTLQLKACMELGTSSYMVYYSFPLQGPMLKLFLRDPGSNSINALTCLLLPKTLRLHI